MEMSMVLFSVRKEILLNCSLKMDMPM